MASRRTLPALDASAPRTAERAPPTIKAMTVALTCSVHSGWYAWIR
ncbi:hypothetical protein [Accumulibacter sp.]|nr:hypothetical protein [Accumulibacter sp.]